MISTMSNLSFDNVNFAVTEWKELKTTLLELKEQCLADITLIENRIYSIDEEIKMIDELIKSGIQQLSHLMK